MVSYRRKNLLFIDNVITKHCNYFNYISHCSYNASNYSRFGRGSSAWPNLKEHLILRFKWHTNKCPTAWLPCPNLQSKKMINMYTKLGVGGGGDWLCSNLVNHSLRIKIKYLAHSPNFILDMFFFYIPDSS